MTETPSPARVSILRRIGRGARMATASAVIVVGLGVTVFAPPTGYEATTTLGLASVAVPAREAAPTAAAALDDAATAGLLQIPRDQVSLTAGPGTLEISVRGRDDTTEQARAAALIAAAAIAERVDPITGTGNLDTPDGRAAASRLAGGSTISPASTRTLRPSLLTRVTAAAAGAAAAAATAFALSWAADARRHALHNAFVGSAAHAPSAHDAKIHAPRGYRRRHAALTPTDETPTGISADHLGPAAQRILARPRIAPEPDTAPAPQPTAAHTAASP